MTQKELAYVEDAIGHECNIIKILEENISQLSDEDIADFLNGEVETHLEIKNQLIELLEGECNE